MPSKVTGVKVAVANLSNIERQTTKKFITHTLVAIGNKISSIARSNTPVITGALRDSRRVETIDATHVDVIYGIFYAAKTHFRSSRPYYLSNAGLEVRTYIKEIVDKTLAKDIKKLESSLARALKKVPK